MFLDILILFSKAFSNSWMKTIQQLTQIIRAEIFLLYLIPCQTKMINKFEIFLNKGILYCRGKQILQVPSNLRHNPPMTRGGGEICSGTNFCMPPPTCFSSFFSGTGRAFISKRKFSCSLILGTSFYLKFFHIGSTVLALKLDKWKVGGWGNHPHGLFSYIFF